MKMTLDQSNSTMSSLSFASQEHQQTPVPSGNDALMSMLISRQPSRLTANMYGHQNTIVPHPSTALVPQQPQLVNNGNFAANQNAINTSNNNVSCQGDQMRINVAENSNSNQHKTNISGDLPQQVQIAGLNGITFSLPQPSLNTSGATASQFNDRNGTIDALTLSSLNGTVPEFLYQLTKMLTDEGNREVIVWNPGMCLGNHQIGGRIEVHSPKRMEEEVLGKYFRHSKYASFQRQLNYFGFRKIAGKGKMSPCSYVNDMATSDIRSLLLIKRKGVKVNADDVSLASSDNGKTCTSDDGRSGKSTLSISNCYNGNVVGKKRRPSPESNSDARLNQPISVAAVGPPPNLGNQQSTFQVPPPIGDSGKRAKVDSSMDNHYIKVTDNNSFGMVTKNSIKSNNSLFPTTLQNHGDSLLNAYNMALTQGNHQTNNFAAGNSSNGTVVSSNTSSYNGSQHSTSTISTIIPASAAPATLPTSTSCNNTSFNSYLAHPSSQHALFAPAPMQFLDPSELGMSIENSLNELKSNFNAANRVAATMKPMQSQSELTTANPGFENEANLSAMQCASISAPNEQYFSTSSTATSTKPEAHMLSRDDSLINLAMLPTLEYFPDNTSYDTLHHASYSNNGSTSEFLHRNDSLIELAASVAHANNANFAITNQGNTSSSENENVNNDENSSDPLSFLDFSGQM